MLDQTLNLKIVDFGLAAYIKKGPMHSKVGTANYSAPEVFEGNYQGQDADLFSSAIILFCLVCGGPPFKLARPDNPHYAMFCKKKPAFWNFHMRNRPTEIFTE